MRIFINSFCIALTAAIFLFLPSLVKAAGQSQDTGLLNTACQQAPDSAVCHDASNQIKKNTNPVVDVVQKATNLIAVIAGIGAVIVIIISGIQYSTAGGAAAGQRAGDNPTKAKNARAMLANAVIGLIIITLAWAIISFVIQKVIK